MIILANYFPLVHTPWSSREKIKSLTKKIYNFFDCFCTEIIKTKGLVLMKFHEYKKKDTCRLIPRSPYQAVSCCLQCEIEVQEFAWVLCISIMDRKHREIQHFQVNSVQILASPNLLRIIDRRATSSTNMRILNNEGNAVCRWWLRNSCELFENY